MSIALLVRPSISPNRIGDRIDHSTDVQIKYGLGYDHCWVFADGSGGLQSVATVFESANGWVMTVQTTHLP